LHVDEVTTFGAGRVSRRPSTSPRTMLRIAW
jgi:hypothetical protein